MCARLQVPRSLDTEEGKANGVSLLSLNGKKQFFFFVLLWLLFVYLGRGIEDE